MPRTIASVDQMDKHQIIVTLSDGTVMQFDVEELAMMSDYQIRNWSEKQPLRSERVQ